MSSTITCPVPSSCEETAVQLTTDGEDLKNRNENSTYSSLEMNSNGVKSDWSNALMREDRDPDYGSSNALVPSKTDSSSHIDNFAVQNSGYEIETDLPGQNSITIEHDDNIKNHDNSPDNHSTISKPPPPIGEDDQKDKTVDCRKNSDSDDSLSSVGSAKPFSLEENESDASLVVPKTVMSESIVSLVQSPTVKTERLSDVSICTWPTQTTLVEICRICHCERDSELGPLIAPCHCKGSLRYVHQACLQQWIKSSDSKNCELCRYQYVMDTKLKPLREWKKLKMSTAERRKFYCTVLFHLITITCAIGSLYVLAERTADEIREGKLQWPFWTKLVVVGIGFVGGIVFMYIQCKQVYVQLWRRLKAFNREIYVKNNSPSVTSSPTEAASPDEPDPIASSPFPDDAEPPPPQTSQPIIIELEPIGN